MSDGFAARASRLKPPFSLIALKSVQKWRKKLKTKDFILTDTHENKDISQLYYSVLLVNIELFYL